MNSPGFAGRRRPAHNTPVPRARHCLWDLAAGLLTLVAACAPTSEDIVIDPSGVDFEVAVLVEVQDQAVQRLSAPFGPAPDGFGQPTLQGLDPQHSLYLVSVDLGTLRAAVPGYDARRISEFAVTSLSTTRLDDSGDPARIVLPADTRVHRVDLEGATLIAASFEDVPSLATLALVVPTDVLHCERILKPVVSFGARNHLLSPPSFAWPTAAQEGFHRIRDLVPLSRERVIAMTSQLLFDLREGEDVQAPGSGEAPRTHHVASVGVAGANFDALALNPAGDALWVSGPAGGDRGFLARYDIEADGLRLAQVYAQDDTGAPLPVLRDVHVDAQGQVLAGGEPRKIVLRRQGTDSFVQVELPDIDKINEADGNIQFITTTGDPGQPHLIGLKGDAVLQGDAESGLFTPEYVQSIANRPLGVSPYLEDGLTTSVSERWAVGRGAIFSRWSPAEGWVGQTLRETPNASACTLGASLNSTAVHYFTLAVDAAHVFLAADRCNAVIAQDRVDGCTAVLTLPDEELARVGEEAVRVLRLGHGRLWIAGEQGRLYTVDRP